MADVLILTGPPGSGKSSVAQALADRYDRVAHIDVDILRHFITPTGYVAPDQAGFAHQQQLAIRNACDLTRNFLAARVAVIVDDIVLTAEDLDRYQSGLEACGVPIHFIRLLPDLETCQRRNAGRRDARVPPERVERLHTAFSASDIASGETIDSSDLSAEQTVDKVQSLTTAGQGMIWSPSS